MPDAVVTILLGGLGGALASQAIQLLRDGAQERRKVRAAAGVIRGEIIANKALVGIVLMAGTVPTMPRWHEPRNDRFERTIDALMSEFSRNRLAQLFGFNAMHPELVRILTDARSRVITPGERKWLAEVWWPDADHTQSLLDFKAGRWWDRFRYRQAWLDLKVAEKKSDFEAADFANRLKETGTSTKVQRS